MIRSSYPDLYNQVMRIGYPVESRYGGTKELRGVQFSFDAGLVVFRPKMNLGIGWQEMLQLIAGDYDPPSIARVAPNANLELFTAKMAYGPRLKDQIPFILEALDNPDSRRQCVLFVGHPDDGPTPDLPCTLTIQLLPLRDVLHMEVSMRSWDLIKGLPYDVMMFGGLLLAICQSTLMAPGLITVTAGSAHIYDSDKELVPTNHFKRFQMPQLVNTDWLTRVEWARYEYQMLERYCEPIGVELDWA